MAGFAFYEVSFVVSTDSQSVVPGGSKETPPENKVERKAVSNKRAHEKKQAAAVEPVPKQPIGQASPAAPEPKRALPAKELREWLTLTIAVFGLAVAASSLIYTGTQDRANREDQRVQQATSQAIATVQQATSQAIATVQQATSQAVAAVRQATVQAEATSDASLAHEIVSIKQTQIAYEADQAKMLRMQVFPFMHGIGGDPAVLTLVEARVITDTHGGSLILGTGQISTTLANDGGADAGLIAVQWVAGPDARTSHDLRVESVAAWSKGVSDRPPLRAAAVRDYLNLPLSIESQSAIRVTLDVASEIAIDGDLTAKTPYQLGRIFSDTLKVENTSLVFLFSNTEPLTVSLRAMNLALPVQALRTDPPGPFVVTDADQTRVVCINVADFGAASREQVWIWFDAPGGESSVEVLVDTRECFTLPVRDDWYKLRWRTGGGQASCCGPIEPTKGIPSASSMTTMGDYDFRVTYADTAVLEISLPLRLTAAGIALPTSTPTPIPNQDADTDYEPDNMVTSVGLVIISVILGTGVVILLRSRRRIMVKWVLARLGFTSVSTPVELHFSVFRRMQNVPLTSYECLILRREGTGYAVTLLRWGEEHAIGFASDEELVETPIEMSFEDLHVTLERDGRAQ